MAAADVLLPSSASSFDRVKRKRSSTGLASSLASAASSKMTPTVTRKVKFDPATHLAFVEPKKIWTMEELGLKGNGVSPHAVTEPFSLFTADAIKEMRSEILSKEVKENCAYSSNLSHCQLRGFAPEYAPFVYDAWRNPEVLKIVSKLAGVELVPQMDFEIAHINISGNPEEQKEVIKNALEEIAHRDADEGVSGCPFEDDEPIVDWHTDSYPFVCVTMLSDCTKMIGGETALRKGNGEVMRVRGPQMGNAVVMQGRYIEHQAMRALGTTERITMVTSFRPKSVFIPDDTVLTTVRSISNLSELYSQYSEYRLEMLEERLRAHLKHIREGKTARLRFDTAATKAFISEQKAFLESMLKEMVDDDKVVVGFTDESHLLSEELKIQARKRVRLQSEEAA